MVPLAVLRIMSKLRRSGSNAPIQKTRSDSGTASGEPSASCNTAPGFMADHLLQADFSGIVQYHRAGLGRPVSDSPVPNRNRRNASPHFQAMDGESAVDRRPSGPVPVD